MYVIDLKVCNWKEVVAVTGLEKNYEILKRIVQMLTHETEKNRERKKEKNSSLSKRV